MGSWSVRENSEKGFQLKIREKELFFGAKIRDKGVAFILWDKHENEHSLSAAAGRDHEQYSLKVKRPVSEDKRKYIALSQLVSKMYYECIVNESCLYHVAFEA